MKNFDFVRTDSSLTSTIAIDYERIRMVSNNHKQKLRIYVDSSNQDHDRPLSYFKQDKRKQLIPIDPYLHFDLTYFSLRNSLPKDDLNLLHLYIKQHLEKIIGSSDSPEDKVRCQLFSLISNLW